MRYSKYAFVALALLVAGCATDRSYQTAYAQCAAEPGMFDADLCDANNTDD